MTMILRERYDIPEFLRKEAQEYAIKSKAYTSNRHDFHSGSLKDKERKMLEGKLGEKIFKMFLQDNDIEFEEDQSNHKEADYFDFRLPNGYLIDVKTRTKSFHVRTVELVEQLQNKPKDIYISIRLNDDLISGHIIGWCSRYDLLRVGRIENLGYLDNYVMYDDELRSMPVLYGAVLQDFKISH